MGMDTLVQVAPAIGVVSRKKVLVRTDHTRTLHPLQMI